MLHAAATPFSEGEAMQVDAALRETPGPWILGGERPSLVDFQYISHVERMVPSVRPRRPPSPSSPPRARVPTLRLHAGALLEGAQDPRRPALAGRHRLARGFRATPKSLPRPAPPRLMAGKLKDAGWGGAAYMATKSDYYTHIKDIPPQYGPGDARGIEDNADVHPRPRCSTRPALLPPRT